MTVSVKARTVSVSGPRGSLEKNFSHSRVEMAVVKNNTLVNVEMWFGNRKERARTRTIASHIANMIKGVTMGYEYKMRMVYAHFPINVNLEDSERTVAIRNFLGEKKVMKVNLLPGMFSRCRPPPCCRSDYRDHQISVFVVVVATSRSTLLIFDSL